MTQAQYTPPRNAAGHTATKADGNSKVPSALLPRDILAGREFQVGDEIRMQIVNIYEDEMEVKLLGVRSGELVKAGEVIMEAAAALEQQME